MCEKRAQEMILRISITFNCFTLWWMLVICFLITCKRSVYSLTSENWKDARDVRGIWRNFTWENSLQFVDSRHGSLWNVPDWDGVGRLPVYLVLNCRKRKKKGISNLFAADKAPQQPVYLQHFFQTILHTVQVSFTQIHKARRQHSDFFLLLCFVHCHLCIGNRSSGRCSINQVRNKNECRPMMIRILEIEKREIAHDLSLFSIFCVYINICQCADGSETSK